MGMKRMGNLRAAFDSVSYAIAVLCFCLLLSIFFGIWHQFGRLFSLFGLIAVAFLVFGMTAK